MKYKVSVIGILVSLVFCFSLSYGADKQQTNITWKIAAAANGTDSISHTTIIMDSVKIAYLKSFLDDTLSYSDVHSRIDNNIKTLQSELAEFQSKAEKGEYGHTELWIRILVIVNAVLLVLLIAYFIIWVNGLRSEVEDIVISSGNKSNGKLKKWFDEKLFRENSTSNFKSYDNDIRSLKDENRRLKERMNQLEDTLKERKSTHASIPLEHTTEGHPMPLVQPVEDQKLLFADNINDKGYFSHVINDPNDDTVFVLKLKGDEDALVTLYQPAYVKVTANPAFLEGCEKQIVGSTTVIIREEGKATRDGNGKWKVITKVKVEIR